MSGEFDRGKLSVAQQAFLSGNAAMFRSTTSPPQLLPSPQALPVFVNTPPPAETVVLFPSLGRLAADGETWNLHVQGEVYTHSSAIGMTKRFFLRLLKRAMNVPETAFSTDVFRKRIARFLARDEAGRKITLRIGKELHQLPKPTFRNGHFVGTINAHASEILPAGASGDARVAIDVCTSTGEHVCAQGSVFLLADRGWSVISDIDDTIKHSAVADKQTLLQNTFLHQYEPVAGMVDLYRRWAEAGMAFHYVSSCPWQLYVQIAEHLAEVGFPAGSFHLRTFRLRDDLIRRLLLLRRTGKSSVLLRILKTCPNRKFILVGDCGEQDPEIYGAAARRFPDQVERILIRRLLSPYDTAERYSRAFRGVREGVVQIYSEASEIVDNVESTVKMATA